MTFFTPALFFYLFNLIEGQDTPCYLLMLLFALFGTAGANPMGLGVSVRCCFCGSASPQHA